MPSLAASASKNKCIHPCLRQSSGWSLYLRYNNINHELYCIVFFTFFKFKLIDKILNIFMKLLIMLMVLWWVVYPYYIAVQCTCLQTTKRDARDVHTTEMNALRAFSLLAFLYVVSFFFFLNYNICIWVGAIYLFFGML